MWCAELVACWGEAERVAEANPRAVAASRRHPGRGRGSMHSARWGPWPDNAQRPSKGERELADSERQGVRVPREEWPPVSRRLCPFEKRVFQWPFRKGWPRRRTDRNGSPLAGRSPALETRNPRSPKALPYEFRYYTRVTSTWPFQIPSTWRTPTRR